MRNEWLVLTGSVYLTIALAQAWALVVVLTNPTCSLATRIPGWQDLVKSHIDYLLMSLFLFVLFLLFVHFQTHLPTFFALSLILGALENPALFFIRALYPALKQEPSNPFRIAMTASCVLTTLGYLAGAWVLAAAALSQLA
jgi:hypothetical protein